MSQDLFSTLQPSPIIVGAGLLALDAVVPFGAGAPTQLRAGGTCGNVLTILSYLGWNALPVARLKSDGAAELIRKDLKAWRVNTDYVSTGTDGSTPVFIQRIGRTADGSSIHTFSRKCPNCGNYLPAYKAHTAAAVEQLMSQLPKPSVYFFDRVSRGTLLLAKHFGSQGAVVMFEPSGIGEPHLFREAVQIAHILKYSNERLGEAEELLAACGSLLQIETLGGEGLRFRTRLSTSQMSAWKVLKALQAKSVLDTSGAGDWATAGLLHRLCQPGVTGLNRATKETYIDALRFGQALGAWNCGYEGARGGMYIVEKLEFFAVVKAILAKGKVAEQAGTEISEERPVSYDFCSLCKSL